MSKPRKPQWHPTIAVRPHVYTAIKARAEQLGIPMSDVVMKLVNDAICSVCHRAAVLEPGARTCGADACVHGVLSLNTEAHP